MSQPLTLENLIQQLQNYPELHVSIGNVSLNPSSSRMAFDEWAHFWLETYKKGIVKDNTYDGTMRNPVEVHLVPYFGSRPLNSISAADIQIFFKTLIDTKSLETQRKIKNALYAIFSTAIECHKCTYNPVTENLRLSSRIAPIQKNTWTASQYTTAFQFALGHKYGLEIITLMETAMSRSELLGLSWNDLCVGEKRLSLRNGLVSQKSTVTGQYELVHDGLKNKYRYRSIPISSLLCGLLTLKPRVIVVGGKKKKPSLVFHAPDGGPHDPRNWYRRVLVRFMRDLHEEHPGVPILTTHELRHTRATLLKDEGVDIFSISRLLGHVDLNMLAKRYAHDNVETLRKALGV
jgi:integrase